MFLALAESTDADDDELAPDPHCDPPPRLRALAGPAPLVRHRLLAADGRHPVGQPGHVRRPASGETEEAAPYLLAGIIMFHILFQSQIAVATGFMEETWSRNLLNVLTTPVTEVEYVAGTAVFGLAKVLLACRR